MEITQVSLLDSETRIEFMSECDHAGIVVCASVEVTIGDEIFDDFRIVCKAATSIQESDGGRESMGDPA